MGRETEWRGLSEWDIMEAEVSRLRGEIAVLSAQARNARMHIGLLLLAAGGKITIPLYLQEKIDYHDCIETHVDVQGNITLTYRKQGA